MKQFHLRISESFTDKLNELKELTGAPSQAAVLRDAVCVYTWLLHHISEGHEVVAIDRKAKKTKEFEVYTPGVDEIKTKLKHRAP